MSTRKTTTKRKPRIKRVIVEIAGKDTEMTLEEARQLKKALDELFPVAAAPIMIPYERPHPYRSPDPIPYWTGDGPALGDTTEISCGGMAIDCVQ